MKPHKKEFFDKYASEWDEITYHDPEKLKFIVELLSLKEGQNVLDVGSGTGVMIPFLNRSLKNTGKIDAVDFSEKMIELAKNKYSTQKFSNVEFIVQDVSDMNMNHQYDVILCYSCFPHFDDKMAKIKHLAKGLCPGGKLVIAHSESRKSINSIHKDEIEVKNDLLPTMNKIEHMMKIAGLHTIRKIDNNEMFIIISKRLDNTSY
jgi:demethylmenaquinone methyltransferase/2-methoxy-6-polyprenyl-1,4-benzoquinol methylase